MKEFQHDYLNHVNRYTKLRYKDDPAVMGVLITNENDLTNHGGNMMLPDNKNPFHNALWTKGYKAFAAKYGLPADRVFQTWLPGPEQALPQRGRARVQPDDDRRPEGDGRQGADRDDQLLGGGPAVLAPPADRRRRDRRPQLWRRARRWTPMRTTRATYLSWIAAGQVYGKPLTITEWNVRVSEDRPIHVPAVRREHRVAAGLGCADDLHLLADRP